MYISLRVLEGKTRRRSVLNQVVLRYFYESRRDGCPRMCDDKHACDDKHVSNIIA